MNEDITCPMCSAVCTNADAESYEPDDQSYQNENYCDNCHCNFNAVYKFSHIINNGRD